MFIISAINKHNFDAKNGDLYDETMKAKNSLAKIKQVRLHY